MDPARPSVVPSSVLSRPDALHLFHRNAVQTSTTAAFAVLPAARTRLSARPSPRFVLILSHSVLQVNTTVEIAYVFWNPSERLQVYLHLNRDYNAALMPSLVPMEI